MLASMLRSAHRVTSNPSYRFATAVGLGASFTASMVRPPFCSIQTIFVSLITWQRQDCERAADDNQVHV